MQATRVGDWYYIIVPKSSYCFLIVNINLFSVVMHQHVFCYRTIYIVIDTNALGGKCAPYEPGGLSCKDTIHSLLLQHLMMNFVEHL